MDKKKYYLIEESKQKEDKESSINTSGKIKKSNEATPQKAPIAEADQVTAFQIQDNREKSLGDGILTRKWKNARKIA